MSSQIKRRRQRRRLKWELCWIAGLTGMVILLFSTAAAESSTLVEITIKAAELSMVQETEMPSLTAEAILHGKKEQILDPNSKYSVGDLMEKLKGGEGYSLACEADGVTEGEFPITVALDPDIENALSSNWKGKLLIHTEDAVLTVQNKYGSWDGKKFKRTDDTYVMNDFIVSKGNTYYFDAEGNMAVGWQEVNSSKYCFDEEGRMRTGWYEEDAAKYYFDTDGRMHIGWFSDGENRYYFDYDGKMVTGDKKIGVKSCTFDEEGRLTHEEGGVDPTRPMIALTFDDGPGPRTMELLNALEQYGARATFFMCGTSLSRSDIDVDAILKKMDEIGCDTSNHTMNHPQLNTLSAEEIRQQVGGVSDIIASHVGHGARNLRPPYGAGIHSETVINNVGLPMIYWSVDTMDWKTKSKDATVQAILQQAKDGDIVLLHDIHDWSVEAAIEVIPKLINAGYQLVPVSEMAEARGITLQNGVTYFDFYPAG